MAALELDKLWVNLMATGEAVSAYSAPGRPESHGIQGEVRTYAGGRRRSVAVVGVEATYAFTLLMLTAAQLETLRGWKGLPVQVRDNKGRRFVGVYYAVPADEVRDAVLYHAAIELHVVTDGE